MTKSRKQQQPEFKAKVELAALREKQTVAKPFLSAPAMRSVSEASYDPVCNSAYVFRWSEGGNPWVFEQVPNIFKGCATIARYGSRVNASGM